MFEKTTFKKKFQKTNGKINSDFDFFSSKKTKKSEFINLDVEQITCAAWFDKKEYTEEKKQEGHFFIDVISENNYKQDEFGLKQFANGIIKAVEKGSKIKKVFFLNTMYLHRFYDKKYSNPNEISKRTEEIEKSISILSTFKIPYEIIDWKTLTTGKYDDAYKTLKKWVNLKFVGDEKSSEEIDEDFRKAVLETANEQGYSGKGSKKQTIEYLIEECTVSCLFIKWIGILLKELNEQEIDVKKGYITYSGDFNNPIKKIFKALSIGYDLCLMSDNIINIKENTLYVKPGKEPGSIEYTVILPTNEKVTNIITTKQLPALEEAMKNESKLLENLKKLLPDILGITSKKGHTFLKSVPFIEHSIKESFTKKIIMEKNNANKINFGEEFSNKNMANNFNTGDDVDPLILYVLKILKTIKIPNDFEGIQKFTMMFMQFCREFNKKETKFTYENKKIEKIEEKENVNNNTNNIDNKDNNNNENTITFY